ncbi:MAG: choice-of-anchor Q domain-containing protein, partial [Candidatus Promineifilaceae bacterium]
FGRNNGDSLLYNLGNGPYETIVLKNVVLDSGDFGADCETGGTEPITSAGNNLFTDDSCPYIAAGDQRFSDAKLGPLADHGGSTLTHMPLAGSPLIDRGIAVDTPSVDQRGLPRPSGAGVDIGSVERQPDDSDSFDIFLPLSIR